MCLYCAVKLFYLALNNIAEKWTMPVQNWKPVLNRFTTQFGERMPTNEHSPLLHKIRDTLLGGFTPNQRLAMAA
jgi:hypothetical protein